MSCAEHFFTEGLVSSVTSRLGKEERVATTYYKGNCAFADLRYGKEDSISPSKLLQAEQILL